LKSIFSLILVVLLIPSQIGAQSFKITKIIDTNLFETDKGKQISFYGVYMPSLFDSNKSVVKIAKQIYEWETSYLLNQNYSSELIEKSSGFPAKCPLFCSVLLIDM